MLSLPPFYISLFHLVTQHTQQIHVPITGTTAVRVPAGSNVIDVLKSLGNYQTFLLALQVGGGIGLCVVIGT